MLTSMSMCNSCVSCSSAKIQNCKKTFTLGARGFPWEFSGFGQVLKVTCTFFLFCLFSYFSFFKLTRVFSRCPHPAKAPRRTREKTFGTQGKRCLVKQIFFRMADYEICHPLSCTDFVVFLFSRQKFVYCKSCNENFPTFSPATKRLENNWTKATSSSRLFVCRSNFLAVYCWSHFTGYCKRYWRIRNLSQSESVKYLEWILSGVMFRSCPSVFKYVSRSRISGLRLAHEFTFLFFVV